MKEGPDPYKQVSLNPRTLDYGLKKHQEINEIQIPKDNAVMDIEIFKFRNNVKSPDFNSLIEDLNGVNPFNQERALKTLCRLKNKTALSILISALKNKNTNIRWKAARYLGHSMNKNVVEPLIESLKDPDFIVRNNAAWSLGEIGDEIAIEPLTLALEDENKYVKGSAREALDKIRNI